MIIKAVAAPDDCGGEAVFSELKAADGLLHPACGESSTLENWMGCKSREGFNGDAHQWGSCL